MNELSPINKAQKKIDKNLFESVPVDIGTLLGNGQKFNVPIFQRNYTWDKDNWQELWDNILEVYHHKATGHYLGNIVLLRENHDNDKKIYQIIDGQQRITTISILLIALLSFLDKLKNDNLNNDRVNEIRHNYINIFDSKTGLRPAKLTLNRANRNYYMNYLSQMNFEKPEKNTPARDLHNAFKFFQELIAKDLSAIINDGLKIYEFITNVILEKLFIIRIIVVNEYNAYLFFENLNSAGEPLTTADLVKNLIFSKYPDSHEEIDELWQELELLANKRLPDLLRYFHISEDLVKKQDLYFYIRDLLKNKDANYCLDYVRNVIIFIRNFNSFKDSNHENWSGNIKLKNLIAEFAVLEAFQLIPVLIIVKDKPKILCELLELFINVIMRYLIISKKQTNILEGIYHHLAQEIIKNENFDIIDCKNIIQNLQITDEQFIANFAEKSFKNNEQKLVKYILGKLNGLNFQDAQSLTIEHIASQSLKSKKLWMLGNLVLLEYQLNNDADDKEFFQKRQIYLKSKYQDIKDIANNNENWNDDNINFRQRNLAEQATKIWKNFNI